MRGWQEGGRVHLRSGPDETAPEEAGRDGEDKGTDGEPMTDQHHGAMCVFKWLARHRVERQGERHKDLHKMSDQHTVGPAAEW